MSLPLMSQTSIPPKTGLRCFRFCNSMDTLRRARCAFLASSHFSAATLNNCARCGLLMPLNPSSNSRLRVLSALFATVLELLFDDSRMVCAANLNLNHQVFPLRYTLMSALLLLPWADGPPS